MEQIITLNQLIKRTKTKEVQDTTTYVSAYVYASVLAALFIAVGIIWDISWHMSIGRDGILSPPHLLVYLGALIAGLFSGFKILKISFASSKSEKENFIKFWWFFHGSLGMMLCVGGAFAMLLSAPFDDWWHNTYGLDVKILSPPHTVLAIGIVMILLGATISTLQCQNEVKGHLGGNFIKMLFIISSGILLGAFFVYAAEYLGRQHMHKSIFYQITGIVFPLIFVAVGTASKLKWPCTYMALVYMFILVSMAWVLPLFPAEPLLGPVKHPVASFQVFRFPLLLVFPAFGIDLVLKRKHQPSKWLKSFFCGLVFVSVMLVVHWPFGDFLMSLSARNWVFAQDSWYFGADPDWEYRYAFAPWNVSTGWVLVKGIGIAVILSAMSARLGLSWGNWMTKICR